MLMKQSRLFSFVIFKTDFLVLCPECGRKALCFTWKPFHT